MIVVAGNAIPGPMSSGEPLANMTLRDVFASAALQGAITAFGRLYADQHKYNGEAMSRIAYEAADAMLQEREKAR